MAVARIGRRWQITLPRELREYLGLRQGDGIIFVRRDNEIVLHPIRKTLLDLRGSVKVEGPQDFDQVRQAVKAERAKRVVSHDE